mgnify:CR=1 FL=1
MKYSLGMKTAICLYLFAMNLSPALAKEPSGKKQAKKDYFGQFSGCFGRLRLEMLEGHFESGDTEDSFTNSEAGFGLECAYQYKRLKLFSGVEFAIGNLDINHKDSVLDVDLSALQRSWLGWLGLGISATEKLEFSAHAGYRWLPETDVKIDELLYAYSGYYEWDLSNISRKHIEMFGSVGVWEAGVKASYRPVRPLTLSLGVMWQRYSMELEAILDEYAQEKLAIFGDYLEKNISLDSSADILIFVPEVKVCPSKRACTSISFPITISGDNDVWVRGATLVFSLPLF